VFRFRAGSKILPVFSTLREFHPLRRLSQNLTLKAPNGRDGFRNRLLRKAVRRLCRFSLGLKYRRTARILLENVFSVNLRFK
jgi:hypothetical protein